VRRALLTAVAIAAVTAGCGGGGDGEPVPPTVPAPTPEERAAARPPDEAGAIEALLEERVRALEAGDADALARTATSKQRARDRQAVRWARGLALARIGMVTEALETTQGRARVAMTLSYRLRGMRQPFRTGRRITALRTPDGWRVVRDVPRREPLPWEVAAFRVARAPHVVLLTPPGVEPSRLASGLASAYREIRRALPRRELPATVLAIGARDARQTEALTDRIADGVVALANVVVTYGPRPALAVDRVLAQRMIVVASRWGALPEAERASTLEHEMTHTALDPDSSGRTPPWLSEGIALYVSDDDRSTEARARAAGTAPATRLGAISKPGSIFRLDARGQGAAYAASSGAAEAIVARYGVRGLLSLLDAFNDSTIKGRPGRATTDRVLRRTLGTSLAELDAAVAGGG